MSIPPRFAATFCMTKTKARYFLCAQDSSTRKPQRQKGDERHIVCHNHGTEISYEHKRDYGSPDRFESAHNHVGEPPEKSYIFKSAHNRERAEQTRKGTKIEIIKILLVKGYEKAGDCGCNQRDNRHSKSGKSFFKFSHNTFSRRTL